MQVQLQHIADLTEERTQSLLGTTVQELTGDWKGYDKRGPRTTVRTPVGLAPTQRLGESLYSTPGLEGFLTVSAKVPTCPNLVVFPDKLQRGSLLVFRYEPQGIEAMIDHHHS